MRPIPIALKKLPDDDQEGEGGRRRRFGRFRRAARYLGSPLGAWAGIGPIRGSASEIGEIIRDVRTASRRDPRFQTFSDGRFDLAMSAAAFETSVDDLERRLALRRRQSAFTAYACLALTVASGFIWIRAAIVGGAAAGSFLLTLNALGFCMLCLLTAFYHALVNFQIRTRRAASWRDLIVVDHGFWPSP